MKIYGAGEWWKSDIQEVLNEFLASGGDPNISDAFLINGQPGDRYNCSKNGTTLYNPWKISCDAASERRFLIPLLLDF